MSSLHEGLQTLTLKRLSGIPSQTPHPLNNEGQSSVMMSSLGQTPEITDPRQVT
jgi:hypothetical protein